jgi:SAM-dependent methyltransferase
VHDQALEWIAAHATDEAVSVLDIGGRDVNGSPRHLFPSAAWTVLDELPGDGVDIAADAATWDPGDRRWDVVLCAEVFEHTPAWARICATAFRACAPGGRLIVTTAAPGRPPHSGADGGTVRLGEHYGNIEPAALRRALEVAGWADVVVDMQQNPADVRAVAVKPVLVRTPDAAIVTAIYGKYDQLRPVLPQTGLDVEWVLVTDSPDLADGTLGWRVVHEPRPGLTPMRGSRPPKLRPWDYTDAPASVYMDASVWVTSPTLAADFLAAADPVSSFAHPERDCLYTEAAVAAAQRRYATEPVAAQAAHYREQGHPEHWGLWENAVIGRHHTPQVVAMCEAWTGEVDRWSPHDQMSFPYVLRQAGLRAAVLPGRALGSPWHQWGGSIAHFEGSKPVMA